MAKNKIGLRVLHVIKTSDGAVWAAQQIKCLIELGLEIDVILPFLEGKAIRIWESTGATLHFIYLSRAEKSLFSTRKEVEFYKEVVSKTKPDIIHSHFANTTILLRLALGKNHLIPRIFQVPGPLHMEHWPFRQVDLITAGLLDYWIASSEYTKNLYLRSGVSPRRIFLSYYGNRLPKESPGTGGILRRRFGIPNHIKVIGNANYFYAPKYYLGQKTGIKGHEVVIHALSSLLAKRENFVGVFIGGQWGAGHRYEERIKKKARAKLGKRVIFTGKIPAVLVPYYLKDFDCVIHTPLSENCGGVVDSLALGIPTIASKVGGLSEVVINGMTGWLVQPNDSNALVDAIVEVLDPSDEGKRRAKIGQKLVRSMFDVERTALEIAGIYEHIIIGKSIPPPFSAFSFLENVKQ